MSNQNQAGNRKNLIVMPVYYPFSGLTERAFILPELQALKERFDRVILIPLIDGGDLLDVPEGIEYSDCIAHSSFTRHKLLRPLLAPSVPFSWLLDAPANALATTTAARRLKKFAEQEGLTPENTVGYSFWFEYSFSALAMLKQATGIPFVARAHSYDIMIDSAPKIRKDAISESSGIWAISQQAKELIEERYPEAKGKCHVAYLGTDVPSKEDFPEGHDSFAAEDYDAGRFNVVSCSRVVPLKRLELNIRFMRELALARPDLKFSLTHIGGTPAEVESLRKLEAEEEANGGLVPNLTFNFLGNLQSEEVIRTLISTRFDLFILLSNTEGVPVAMMEAMSCAIPIAVTDVGAVTEVMTPECGAILSPNPDGKEFLEKVLPLVDSTALRATCANAARKRIHNFDSKKLRAEWAQTLSEI